MSTRYETARAAEAAKLTVDQRINRVVRAIADREGISLAAMGRRMDWAHSSWMRKCTDNPALHQRYSAEDVERISRAFDVSVGELFAGDPFIVLNSRD